MSKQIRVTLGTQDFTIDSGDLTEESLAQFPNGAMSLASDVLATASGQPISSLGTDTLTATLSAEREFKWTIGAVTLQFTPQFTGALTIRKAGEVFRFTEAEQDDDPALRHIVTVPAGKAYVSIALRVGVDVAAAGGFSAGALGIKGSAQVTDTFALVNHCLVDASTNVGDAIATAFERFVLPLSDTAYRRIGVGDFVEYTFFGKLDVQLALSLGFSGVLFGGASGGEVKRSFSSPLGQLTASAAPTFELGVTAGVGYKHEDAFRIVLHGKSDTQSQLFLFKLDRSGFSAGLQINAGVTLNASFEVESKVKELIEKAAQRVFERVPGGEEKDKLVKTFIDKILSNAEAVDRFVKEAEEQVQTQLKKLDRLKVSAAVGFERISEHAALFGMVFDRTAPPGGYTRAVHGDMRGAMAQTGVTLAPGSYIRSELRKRTSVKIQFFEIFSITSAKTYFEQSTLRYAGNGVFQFRSRVGVQAESDVFGHRKAIEIYFETTAAAVSSGVISDKDIRLRINLSEQNNQEAARRTTSMLHLILQGSPHEGVDDALRRALGRNPKLPVNVGLDLASTAYERLRFSPFSGNKPTNEQTADALNYMAFVKAVDLIYAGSGFGTQGFPDLVDEHKDWARYNRTAIDREDSTRPPNRRQTGNGSTDSVWPQDVVNFPAATVDRSIRPLLRIYMIAAQRFMNFCEDLPKLSQNLDAAATEDALKVLIEQAGDLVQEAAGPFPLFFTKPLATALVKQARGIVKEVIAPGPDDTTESFDVTISIA